MWFRFSAPASLDPAAASLHAWAQAQGAHWRAHGDGWSLQGSALGLAWALQGGAGVASVLPGPALRGSSPRVLAPEPLVVLVDRRTRLRLEAQAWSTATDSLRTSLDARIPEELLWMAGGKDVGWDGPPRALWSQWSVLATRRADARCWLDGPLLQAAQCWQALAGGAPLLLALQGGAVHLRVADAGGEAQVAAAELLALACARAAAAFGTPRVAPAELDLVL
jgi:hypothetical protein